MKHPINQKNLDRCIYYTLRFDKTGEISIRVSNAFELRYGKFYLKIFKDTVRLPLSEFLEKLKDPDYLVNELKRSSKAEHDLLGHIIGDEGWSWVKSKIQKLNDRYLDLEDLSDVELINSMRQKLDDGEYCLDLVSLVNFKIS